MKKFGLLSFVVVAASLAAVGCTSTETTQAPETAQITTGAEVTADQQTGLAVQADTSVQAGTQVSPEKAAEATQPVQ